MNNTSIIVMIIFYGGGQTRRAGSGLSLLTTTRPICRPHVPATCHPTIPLLSCLAPLSRRRLILLRSEETSCIITINVNNSLNAIETRKI